MLSAGAAKGLVLALQEPFAGRAAVEFRCTFGAVGAIREKLLAGEPCDLVILTQAIIDALAAEGRVDATTRAPLGRVCTGIAVPASAPVPRIGSPGELRAALCSARGIYLPDPERATAGIHFVNVLRELGIFEEVRARLRPFPNGATAMRAMADAADPDLIGCTQVTEINYTPGVVLCGVLPAEFELATTYALAVTRMAPAAAIAGEFAALLTGPASVALRREGGFVVD